MRKILKKIFNFNNRSKNKIIDYYGNNRLNKYKDPIFFIGTGRSGTHFFADLYHNHSDVTSYHTDKHNKHDLDSFSRFVKWFDLKISLKNEEILEGFIDEASKVNKIYLEANAYLSFMIREFYESFNSKIILTVRNPHKVVNSLDNKGWYKNLKNFETTTPYPDYNFLKFNHSLEEFLQN